MISSSGSKSETGIKHDNQFKDSKQRRFVCEKEENSLLSACLKWLYNTISGNKWSFPFQESKLK